MDSETAAALRELRRRISRLETKTTPLYLPGGVYTPTYSGATTAGATTYSFQTGSWLQIGSVVFTWGTIAWTAATGTGNAQISLPSTPSAVSTLGNVRCSSVTFAAGAPEILTSGAFFQLRSPATNVATTPLAVEAQGDLIFAIAYLV